MLIYRLSKSFSRYAAQYDILPEPECTMPGGSLCEALRFWVI
jgi:hypothetical protein